MKPIFVCTALCFFWSWEGMFKQVNTVLFS